MYVSAYFSGERIEVGVGWRERGEGGEKSGIQTVLVCRFYLSIWHVLLYDFDLFLVHHEFLIGF